MELSEAKAAIKARFIAQWAISNPSVQVFWPNEQPTDADGLPGTKPVDDNGDPVSFLRIDFQMGAPRFSEFGGGIGSNRWRQTGDVKIIVAAPASVGTDDLDDLVDDAAAALRSYVTAGLGVHESSQVGEAIETGNYFTALVMSSFYFDLVG